VIFGPHLGVGAVGFAVGSSGGPVKSPRPLDSVVDSARAVGSGQSIEQAEERTTAGGRKVLLRQVSCSLSVLCFRSGHRSGGVCDLY